MKKIILTIFLFAGSLAMSFAQDKVIMHNGTVASGKVIENEPSYIRFLYDGSPRAI